MLKNDYKPRILIVFFVFVIFYLIIVLRLYILQIHDNNFFENLANQQYLVELKINPDRGKIYDRTGVNPLTINVLVNSAFVLPRQFQEKEVILNFLEKNYNDVYKKIKSNDKLKFAWLERQLTEERINYFKSKNLKDVLFMPEQSRFYPYNSAAQIVGFTDIDNIGLAGIELYFNKYLQGTPTTVELKKDARSDSFYFDKRIIEEGVKGQKVVLTIDSKLQFLVEQELEKTLNEFNAAEGSVLVINPDNGEILSMVNLPSFDPNQKSIENLEYTKNKIITENYELGSVMKTFAALAALQEGVVTPDEMIDCEGKVAFIDNFRVENWKSVDVISFSDVIKYSSNVGVAKIAQRLGPKLYTHLKRLGFGEKTGIEFPGERTGFVNPPSNWSRSSLIVMSFGYEIMATLLQLGKAFSIIANGGYDIDPVLVKFPSRNKNYFEKKIYKTEAIEQLKVILESIGSVYSKNLEGFRVMGKTGTARAIEDGRYSDKKHNYSFAGIIEKDKYKRVIITFVKDPKSVGLWASQICAPLFNRVAEKMIIQDLTSGEIS
ncbi:penicillin-binding protein 2 [Candidatus Dependentiae bacterium]|nr:penicillin-binding protein 2 [Candidatus Dependentiae bacterium]MBU4387481.1 penicillin-binding protein 2 [Candidatus Dependentiae bacterium]MCG2756492.1 penicillin-binding protein 2 [Candidatus Dependentiae bacterium]